jgi:hypothetical protein
MSTVIKYNSDGLPVSGYLKGSNFVVGATDFGTSADAPKAPAGNVVPNVLEGRNAMRWVPWGPDNNYPVGAAADFRLNGIASRGLKLKGDMLYGKRVVTCRVKGFDDGTQKEVVEIVNDPEINEFLNRSNINAFRNRAITDFVWFGMIFPMFLLNPDRSKISMVVHDKAAKFRFAPFNETLGRIDTVFRSANWPNPSDAQLQEIPCIDSYLYYLEVDRIKYDNKYKYAFPIQSYDILNDYYAVTIHESIRKNGTLQNSNSIPAIVKSMIKNVMSIKYHIKIPLSYWETMYPDFKKMKDTEKDKLVDAKLQEINDFLSGQDNQMKAFISHYTVDRVTQKETGWEIVPLEDKMKYDSWTGVDTAAAAQILFAIGINPAIFGLDSPSGGMGNNGGSNIREAWLTLIASSQGERDTIYSWWPFVREYNGYAPDIELRTIDQVLTTLDQGKGTSKTVS